MSERKEKLIAAMVIGLVLSLVLWKYIFILGLAVVIGIIIYAMS